MIDEEITPSKFPLPPIYFIKEQTLFFGFYIFFLSEKIFLIKYLPFSLLQL